MTTYQVPVTEDLQLLFNYELKTMCYERKMEQVSSMTRPEMIDRLLTFRPLFYNDYIAPTQETLRHYKRSELIQQCRLRGVGPGETGGLPPLSKLNKSQLRNVLILWRPPPNYTTPRQIREHRPVNNCIFGLEYDPKELKLYQLNNARLISDVTPFDSGVVDHSVWINVIKNGPPMGTLEYLETLIEYYDAEFAKNDAATEPPAYLTMDRQELHRIQDLAFSQERRGHALRRALEMIKKSLDPHVPGSPTDKPVGGFGIPLAGWVFNTIVNYSPWILRDAEDFMNAETLALHRMSHGNVYVSNVVHRKRARDFDDDE